MSVIAIEDVAYVRFRAPSLSRMRDYLQDFGLSVAESAKGALWMRGAGDAPFLHWTVEGAPGFDGYGLRARSVRDLELLAAHTGHDVEALGAPGGGAVVRLKDPDGFTVEVVAGQAAAAAQPDIELPAWNFANKAARVNAPRRGGSGPARVLRLGHVVLIVSDLARTWAWYHDLFGVLVSDAVQAPDGKDVALFIRCDRGEVPTDHHSLNFGTLEGKPPSFHHAAFEVTDLDDLMRGHEFLREQGYKHLWGVGRHVLGSQIFDYWSDPWGHRLEHWTDGDVFDSSEPAHVTDVETMVGTQWGVTAPADFT